MNLSTKLVDIGLALGPLLLGLGRPRHAIGDRAGASLGFFLANHLAHDVQRAYVNPACTHGHTTASKLLASPATLRIFPKIDLTTIRAVSMTSKPKGTNQ
jgi:hypothetical protein